METKNFSQRALNAVKNAWNSYPWGELFFLLSLLGVAVLILVDIFSVGECGKGYFICLKIVCGFGLIGYLMLAQGALDTVKKLWRKGFWVKLRTILMSGSGLCLLMFWVSALFLPTTAPVIKAVFEPLGAIGLFGFIFGFIFTGITCAVEFLINCLCRSIRYYIR